LQGANSKDKHPMKGFPQVCFIQNTVSNPNIIIGDYTYYDDPEDSENFERNVLYHFSFVGDRLIIGKFCALATGVKFIMNGANHKLDGFSTYPFQRAHLSVEGGVMDSGFGDSRKEIVKALISPSNSEY
jgi:virginiamycin A acetyltransferase